jgi:hypothetical protein
LFLLQLEQDEAAERVVENHSRESGYSQADILQGPTLSSQEVAGGMDGIDYFNICNISSVQQLLDVTCANQAWGNSNCNGNSNDYIYQSNSNSESHIESNINCNS